MDQDKKEFGWIKMSRLLYNNSLLKKPELLQLYCYLLLKKCHKPTVIEFQTGKGFSKILLKKNECLFGSQTAAKHLNQKWQATYKRLKELERKGLCKTQSKTHYTIVTLYDCNELKETLK